MATETIRPPEGQSVTGLVGGIVADAQELVKQQVALVRAELKADFQRTVRAALLLACGAVGAVAESDVVNKAGEYVSDAWETGSRYFQEHNFKDMADDVAGVIRRNPIPAMLVGIGLGFILARSLRS